MQQQKIEYTVQLRITSPYIVFGERGLKIPLTGPHFWLLANIGTGIGRVSLLSASKDMSAFLYCQPVKPSQPCQSECEPDRTWLNRLIFFSRDTMF